MSNIYLSDDVVELLDEVRTTPKGEIDRSEYLRVMLQKEKKNMK